MLSSAVVEVSSTSLLNAGGDVGGDTRSSVDDGRDDDERAGRQSSRLTAEGA